VRDFGRRFARRQQQVRSRRSQAGTWFVRRTDTDLERSPQALSLGRGAYRRVAGTRPIHHFRLLQAGRPRGGRCRRMVQYGDVARSTRRLLKIVDREKDLVKSGGEWIFSFDVENTARGRTPGVSEAGCIRCPTNAGRAVRFSSSCLQRDQDRANELLDFSQRAVGQSGGCPIAIVFVSELP